MRYCLCIFVLSLLMTTSSLAQSDAEVCRGKDDALVLRYEAVSDRLIVLSWISGDVLQILRESFTPDSVYLQTWSPGCNALLVEWTSDGNTHLEAWEIGGGSLGTLEVSFSLIKERYWSWSPDATRVVFQTADGALFWNLRTGTHTLLGQTHVIDYIPRGLYSIEWDETRNQMMAVTFDALNAVSIFDGQTGHFITQYDAGVAGPVRYARLNNDTELLLHTHRSYNSDFFYGDTPREPVVFALWNRETRANRQLLIPPTSEGEPHYIVEAFDFYGDLSSRYLVLNHEGYNIPAFFVWDTHRLTGDSPHPPTYHLPTTSGGRRFVRFADPGTLEWVAFGRDSFALWRWQLDGGVVLYQERFVTDVCLSESASAHPEQALLDWACAYYREFASRGSEGAQLTWSATRHSYDVGFSHALYWTSRGLED